MRAGVGEIVDKLDVQFAELVRLSAQSALKVSFEGFPTVFMMGNKLLFSHWRKNRLLTQTAQNDSRILGRPQNVYHI
jgi:hypothetical protein